MPPLHRDPDDAPQDAPRARDPRVRTARPHSSDELREILKIVSGSTDARKELIADLRRQIAAGTYMSEEKVNLAIYRLLEDILD